MKEYIDKNRLLEGIYSDNPDDGMLYVANFPSAEVAEVKRGKWINKKYRWIKSISMWWSDAYECSVCGEASIKDCNYCPHCGARMDGGEE